MLKKLTPPKTFRRAWELADYILRYARDTRLFALSTDDYSDEYAKQELLTTIGTIITARWELEPLIINVDYLRLFCARNKPVQPHTTANALDIPPFSAITREAITRLADYAAGTHHAAYAADVTSIIERLPATLDRIRMLSGGGASLKPGASWLK